MNKIAIIETGGKQYKIKENDIIKIEKLPMNVGETIEFDKVLLISEENGNNIQIGTPYLDAKIKAEIVEQGRDKKIRVVKYKPKTRYKRVKGHRQYFTKVKIIQIP